jgi:hypothetical protein
MTQSFIEQANIQVARLQDLLAMYRVETKQDTPAIS